MVSSSVRSYIALTAPLVLFLAVALLIPLVGIITVSFQAEPHFTSNYAEIISSPVYLKVIGMTVLLGVIVSLVTTAMAFLFSLWVLRLPPWWKLVVVAGIVLPFFISYLVRALSWIPILGFNGLFNRVLLTLGWVDAPLALIYNPAAVVLGTANVLFPVAALPLLAAFHKVDRRLLQAAESLGASRRVAFKRVFLPLVRRATMSTAIMIFAIATGFYITPSVLGGGKVLLAPNLIELLIHRRGEWGPGSALAVFLLVVFILSIGLARRFGGTPHRARRPS
ncbi:MAG: ABC transporter permease [Parvibaculaceae bacterium]